MVAVTWRAAGARIAGSPMSIQRRVVAAIKKRSTPPVNLSRHGFRIRRSNNSRKLKSWSEQRNLSFLPANPGSRAWDSHLPIVTMTSAFYLHPPDWATPSIEDQRDVIERPLDNEIDLSGWEIRKALRLLRKSNPPLLEWLSSPIIYQQKSTIPDQFRASLAKYYSLAIVSIIIPHGGRKLQRVSAR